MSKTNMYHEYYIIEESGEEVVMSYDIDCDLEEMRELVTDVLLDSFKPS